MKRSNTIRLTESRLRGIISETVRRIIKEEYDDGYTHQISPDTYQTNQWDGSTVYVVSEVGNGTSIIGVFDSGSDALMYVAETICDHQLSRYGDSDDTRDVIEELKQSINGDLNDQWYVKYGEWKYYCDGAAYLHKG